MNKNTACIALKQANTFGIIWLNKKVIILFVLLCRKCVLFYYAVLHFKSSWLWLNAPLWLGVFFPPFFLFPYALLIKSCQVEARQDLGLLCKSQPEPNAWLSWPVGGWEKGLFFARSGQRGLASCCSLGAFGFP